jgi:Ca2+-binding RTX toxin-like protein
VNRHERNRKRPVRSCRQAIPHRPGAAAALTGPVTRADGDGDDVLFGGPNSDVDIVGESDDTLVGGRCPNIMDGGAGDGTLTGGGRCDFMTIGDDTMAECGGDDVMDRGEGNNRLDGGSGNDRLTTLSGNDVRLGGTGNGPLDTGAGQGSLDGGNGIDSLEGGTGDNILLALGASTSSTTARAMTAIRLPLAVLLIPSRWASSAGKAVTQPAVTSSRA